MDFNEREAGLTIHVPAGTRRAIRSVIDADGTDSDFPVRINEVTGGTVAYRADEYEVRAFATDHDTRSVGYALVEDDRKGRFDREKAEEELDIPPGPEYSRLHDGEAVELDDGRVIRPEQVVGDPRPGRTVVYTGDTRPTDATAAAAEGADLLVHDATFTEGLADRAARTAHSTARQAGKIASRAGVDRLALVHVSTRYAGDVAPHEREAAAVYGGDTFVPDDGESIGVPLPEE
jgi:ribonuclease Z